MLAWMFVVLAWATPALAVAPDAEEPLTGVAWERQLAAPLSVRWSGQALRTALQNLSSAQRIAIFLDRRIDPGQGVELTQAEVPLQQALAELAKQQQLGLSVFHGMTYFGPETSAQDIQTLAALARRSAELTPATRRAVLLKPEAMSWPELTEPGQLISALATKAGLTVVGLEQVPHDLWPAGSWPPLALTDRLTLLAIGFDLQVHFAKDGTAIALRPIASPAKIVSSYDVGAKPAEAIARLQPLAPAAEFKVASGKLFVRGRAEEQDLIQAALRGEAPKKKPSETQTATGSEKKPAAGDSGTKIYTLTIQNQPLRPVLQALAKQMGLTLQMDEAALKAADIDAGQLISFRVEKARLEDLWSAALKPAKLRFKLDGETIIVTPAKD